ncbi:MAG: T9SS type A sorting domain-containing protein [Lewinellaceae bacterium]|nr:T9SS type A sorting domain-containing protein [Phaeodactylibacter sp.]MCB9036750.1 T9SS type A sorting domain-containing protein [Lewinellaceae bacterium]
MPVFEAAEGIPVFQQGRELSYALTGGLEAPQFSRIDLNGDEFGDLLVFDRVGAKALPFVAVAAPEGMRYRYAPAYEAALPPLSQMAKVIDLNCDGLGDLLTTEELGSAADVALKVYLRQPAAGGSLVFQAQRLQLYNSLNDTLIRIHAFDLPAVADINGDELPDLLYIPRGGTQIQYYENISLQTGDCSSLAFELRDDCWGGATYTLEGAFELYACEPGRFVSASGCAGSAMLLLDDDGDGDQDLLFSGIYDFHIQLLANGGDAQQAELSSSSIDWLNGGAALMEFPAPYLLDLEEDGRADLIAATNRINGVGYSPYGKDVYHFRKDNGDGSWNLQSSRFMVKDMIDPGFRSSPAVYDVNEDGLPDLLIAYNSAHPIYGYTSRIALYLNTGSPAEPAFALSAEDFGLLSIYNLKSIHPAMGDLNGDGVPELVLGVEDGRLLVFTNSQSALSNYFPMEPNPLAEVALYGYARPQLIDVDENGTLDLLCGARNGAMAFIENAGSPSAPQFTLVRDTLGGVLPEGYFQECSPFFLKQDDGSYFVYYGRLDGKVSLYQGRLDEDFTLLAPQLSAIDVGERATVVLHDLNADGMPELLAGNMRGGIEIFEANLLSATAGPRGGQLSARAVPNPARRETSIEVEGLSGAASLLVFDATGRLVRNEKIESGDSPHRLNLYGLTAGLYHYRIYSATQTGGGKLIIIK